MGVCNLQFITFSCLKETEVSRAHMKYVDLVIPL